MAQYNVTHACGHEHTYQLYGPGKDRERKIEWLSGQDCPACRKAAENKAAAEASEGLDLPELTGTPKQVAWANTIRGQFIAKFKEFDFSKFHSNIIQYKRVNQVVRDGGLKLALDMVSSETEARFWIVNRFEFIENMLTVYAKKIVEAEGEKFEKEDVVRSMQEAVRLDREASVERDASGAAARDIADTMPDLTGTPDEVQIATGYRAGYFRRCGENNAPMDVIAMLARHYTEASWWLDRHAKCFSLSPTVLASEMRNEHMDELKAYIEAKKNNN